MDIEARVNSAINQKLETELPESDLLGYPATLGMAQGYLKIALTLLPKAEAERIIYLMEADSHESIYRVDKMGSANNNRQEAANA
jgi:hypothetical protein